MKPWLTVLCLLALLAGCAHAPPPPAKVGERAFVLPDPAAAPRGATALRVLAWYPADPDAVERPANAGPVFDAGLVAPDAGWRDGQRHPLVLLSHGFGGAARQMGWLGAALARQGYIAVAVDHPGTNGVDGINPTGAYAPWERASDLRVLLDGVLADPALGPHVDSNRIAVAGFSIGGWTAALSLGAEASFDRFRAFCHGPARDSICNRQVEFDLDYDRQRGELRRAGNEHLLAGERADYEDPRIKAGVLIAPALAQALEPQSLKHISVPVLLVAGTADTVVPTPTNAAWLQPHIAGSTLHELPGVGHYDFLLPCTPKGREIQPALCQENGPPRVETHERTERWVLDFLARALKL